MRVLLVDDDRNLRTGIKMFLEDSEITTDTADSFESAVKVLKVNNYDILIFDIRLGEFTGIDLFKKIKDMSSETPVIFISSGASLSEVAEVMRLGAFDFLEKPFSNEKLLSSIKNAVLISKLKDRVDFEKENQESKLVMLGESKYFESLNHQIRQVSRTNSTVLILGESGTGKELIAQQIHFQSKRKKNSYIKVNCSAIPENLIESELFGHEKGAFTGAEKSKKGFFELADGGTLFLDEIGDMSLSAQAKVLRALQDSEIQKLGSEKIIKVNVRVIAATNKDLEKGIAERTFREDLFFRVNVFPLKSLPLRDRLEDIPILVDYFLTTFLKENGMPFKKISPEVFEILKKHSWPGNIRELKNVVERLAIISHGTITELNLSTFFNFKSDENFSNLSLKDFKDKSERKYILSCLRKFDGVVSKAAEELDIERTYLHRKISQYKITKKEYLL